MVTLVFLVEQLAGALYIFVALGLFLVLRDWLRARDYYRSTHFELERGIAQYRQANALTILILLIEVALVIYGVQRVVAPEIRQQLQLGQTFEQVVSDLPFSTPTPSFLEGGVPIDPASVVLEEEDPLEDRVLVTPTLTPTPVGTIIPNAPAPVGCDTEEAWLQVPANGMVVFQPITVVGVANTDDFAFYRFEINGESTFESFATLNDYTAPVGSQGPLGQFVPAFFANGEYRFRLTVFDATNTLKASCEVTIFITDPIPTPTPLGQDLDLAVDQPAATPAPEQQTDDDQAAPPGGIATAPALDAPLDN